MKHHYVPQFLLRRWCNDRGKLQSFKIRAGRVLCTSQAPEYTGYENALYAVAANTLGIGRDHIERRFFSPIDSKAADALAKIERREPLDQDSKIAWAFFLNSLRLRQPDVLDHMRKEGMAMLKRFLAEGDAALPEGWPSSEEWLEVNYPGMMEARALTSWVPQIVLHNEMTRRFSDLRWWAIEYKTEAPKLLLSDMPLHWEGDLMTEDFFIALPLAPDRLFLGAASEATENFLDSLPAAELIRRINRASLAASRGRIWGADAAAGRAFIEANLDIAGMNVVPLDEISRRFWARRDTHPLC
ncbi:DUF4238 domain-containing protein [Sphingomonas sp. PB2P12]|uniref:DUF4238 domain-containing protein n=1 Tax=Sphingomonas sandaracina TaxID=3096157 RepID=UPI002FC7C14E